MPAQSTPRGDRRVERTRRTLRQALIALIIERGWERVTVQDVCERADVGRSTFYTHFADKEDLLIGGLEDLRRALRGELAVAVEADHPLPFARGMIEHAHDHRHLFLALAGQHTGQAVLRRFRDLVVDLVREDLGTTLPTEPHLEAAIHFIAGGFMELLSFWLESESPLRPPDIERIVLGMVVPTLRSLRERPAPGSSHGARVSAGSPAEHHGPQRP